MRSRVSGASAGQVITIAVLGIILGVIVGLGADVVAYRAFGLRSVPLLIVSNAVGGTVTGVVEGLLVVTVMVVHEWL